MTPYWHVQRLLIGELDLSVARGLRPGLGLAVTAPFRMVRDRIRFEDLARQPYVPPNPDTHHRNETLTHFADPRISLLMSRTAGAWTLGGAIGTTVPLGRTEPNPFALGRLGLPHQHIQFGTGTWNLVLSALAARGIGGFGLHASASAKLAFSRNGHGYQPGQTFGGELGASHPLGAWGAQLALSANREEAETWDGRIEEEGNLGRTDLFARAGLARTMSGSGTFGISLQVPLETWARGEQVELPWVIATSWTR